MVNKKETITFTVKKFLFFKKTVTVNVKEVKYVGMMASGENYVTLDNGTKIVVLNDFVDIMKEMHEKAGWET